MKKIVAVTDTPTPFTKLVSSTDNYTVTTYVSKYTKTVAVKE